MDFYEKKYLKYKSKYIQLNPNMQGGLPGGAPSIKSNNIKNALSSSVKKTLGSVARVIKNNLSEVKKSSGNALQNIKPPIGTIMEKSKMGSDKRTNTNTMPKPITNTSRLPPSVPNSRPNPVSSPNLYDRIRTARNKGTEQINNAAGIVDRFTRKGSEFMKELNNVTGEVKKASNQYTTHPPQSSTQRSSMPSYR